MSIATGVPARGGAGLRAGLPAARHHARQLHAARAPPGRDGDDLLDQLHHLGVRVQHSSYRSSIDK